MKNYVLILACFFVLCSHSITTPNTKNGQISRNIKGLNITIDKRMEVLSVIQYLADSKFVSLKDISYADNVKKYFDQFKTHKVVTLYKEMENRGFNADAPVYLMLFLNSNFEVVRKFDSYLISRASSETKLSELVKAIQDFNTETNFDKFFNDNYKVLKQSIDILIDENFKNFDEINTIEKFYGYEQNSYNIILVALFNGGFGPRVEAGNGRYDVFNILGFNRAVNGIPVYGDEKTFKYMVWHEFSHSYVNPLVDKYYKEFEIYSDIKKPIMSLMSKIGYSKWEAILYEHIVRAITTVLTYEEYGKAEAEMALKAEKELGFIYIDSLYSKILEYSTNREGRSFDQFFYELLAVIINYHENPIDFKYIQTPIEFFSENADFALVYSTNEENDVLNEKIKKYVDFLNKNYYEIPIERIIPDTLALRMNLKDYYIFCYGSINGNLWLKSKVKDLPVQISPDKIVASKTFNQSNLKLVTTWKNPDNPDKFMIIYTAQDSELALDFNFFHGPNHYVIANEKHEIIEMGDYRFRDGKFIIQ